MSGVRPRLLLILTENHTLVDPDDLVGLVRLATDAEEAGFDAVMASEHIVLGPSAGALGRPRNPREYAAPGNQDPATCWPSSNVLLAAVAAATKRVRLVMGAVIAPLRHPVLLAKELATLDRLSEGRLVVQPTVSWHREEYDALGVPFAERGGILDEQLEAMAALWEHTPASHPGPRFAFEDVYCVPKPWRTDPARPRMWFGGQSMHPRLLRRLVRYGDGFHPFGTASAEDVTALRAGLAAEGRDPDSIEMVGGTRAVFSGSDDTADIDRAMADFDDQIAAGFTTFCVKPSQHTDDPREVRALCEHIVERASSLEVPARLGG